ncbi:unnamed protein product, partial [Mesorhabditis spiculigera]
MNHISIHDDYPAAPMELSLDTAWMQQTNQGPPMSYNSDTNQSPDQYCNDRWEAIPAGVTLSPLGSPVMYLLDSSAQPSTTPQFDTYSEEWFYPDINEQAFEVSYISPKQNLTTQSPLRDEGYQSATEAPKNKRLGIPEPPKGLGQKTSGAGCPPKHQINFNKLTLEQKKIRNKIWTEKWPEYAELVNTQAEPKVAADFANEVWVIVLKRLRNQISVKQSRNGKQDKFQEFADLMEGLVEEAEDDAGTFAAAMLKKLKKFEAKHKLGVLEMLRGSKKEETKRKAGTRRRGGASSSRD